MNEKLKSLYKTVILEHDRHPVRYEKREDATHVVKAYNPVCGDRFELYFEVADNVIRDISFHGFGCAISKASTSVLVKKLEGMPLDEAATLITSFIASVTPDAETAGLEDEELIAFSAAREFPGRLKCATLAWEEMGEWGKRGVGE